MNRLKGVDGLTWIQHKFDRIPPLTIKHIDEHFIQHRMLVTATKPFEKGYRTYDANKVKSLSIHPVKHDSLYCTNRAAVLPSQRKDCL